VTPPPFDAAKLDDLMERAGIDVLVATSRHNVRYLLGTYSDFFRHFDAIGVDRYLPAVGYVRGKPHDAFLIAHGIDRHYFELEDPWVETRLLGAQTSLDTAELVQKRTHGTLAIEHSFAPISFARELGETVDAAPVLEELRAIKRPDELTLLKQAAEGIVDAIAAAVAPNLTTRELTDRLRTEEQHRGLGFEYCLIAAGESYNRAPSDQLWDHGVLSVDSGGEREGYIGDLCRMAVIGEPTQQMTETLEHIRAIQDAARGPIAPGTPGRAIYDAVSIPDGYDFVAHGMGLVSHEAPRLSAQAPIRYPADHADRPLEAGMVLSIETEARIDGVGLIKLEDTVAVTETGWEAYGDTHRDWLRCAP
jgi:Xaa-Pro aminopeptidase